MARGRSTFGKLQRYQAKKDRARAKMDDRQSRRGGQGPRMISMATATRTARSSIRLGSSSSSPRLHEDLADGRISLDDFEVRQEELRSKMVVE